MADAPPPRPHLFGVDALHMLRDAGLLGEHPEYVQEVVIHIKHDDYVVMYTSNAAPRAALEFLMTDPGLRITQKDLHADRALLVASRSAIAAALGWIDGGPVHSGRPIIRGALVSAWNNLTERIGDHRTAPGSGHDEAPG